MARLLPALAGVLFLLAAVQPVFSQPTRSAVYLIEETYSLQNLSPTLAKDIRVRVFLLDNQPWFNQLVVEERIEVNEGPASPEVVRTEDNRVAYFRWGELPPGDSRTITITQLVKVDRLAPVDPSLVGEALPAELLGFTRPIPHLWESDHPELRSKALELTAGESNPYSKARRIFEFVLKHLTYAEQPEEHGALWAYTHGVGDCTEYTNLFIALCRAAGIPARFASGFCYREGVQELEALGHAFALIYLPEVGWSPVDLTWPLGKGQFCELGEDHLVQLVSNGNNLLQNSYVRIPGSKVTYRYEAHKPDPGLGLEYEGRITLWVGVKTELRAAPGQKTWEFEVKVKNVGQTRVENLRVELKGNEALFEIPPPAFIPSLEAGERREVGFKVEVKADVEDEPLRAVVSYSSAYGRFLAGDEVLVSARLPTVLELPVKPELLLLLAVVAVVVALAALLVR